MSAVDANDRNAHTTSRGTQTTPQGYAWGGKDHWWFDLGPDSHWQHNWRGDTTERSRLLLQTLHKQEPDEIALEEEEDEEEKEVRRGEWKKGFGQR